MSKKDKPKEKAKKHDHDDHGLEEIIAVKNLDAKQTASAGG